MSGIVCRLSVGGTCRMSWNDLLQGDNYSKCTSFANFDILTHTNGLFLGCVITDLPVPAVKLTVQSLGNTLFRYR